MALFKRRRILATKAETSPGTIISVDATNATCPVYDVIVQQAAEMAERPMGGTFGRHPSIPTNRVGRATWKSHLYANATQPAGITYWLQACGLGYTGGAHVATHLTPDAVGTTTKSLTIASYQDGRLKRLHGCMGTARINMPASNLAECDWDFQGIWNAPTDATLLVPTFVTAAPLRVISATLTLGSYADFVVANVGLDIGNTVYLREDVSAAEGISMAIITDRLVKITIDPEAALVATKDAFGEWLAGTEADLSVELSNADGDTCLIEVSDVQIINPQEADRNNLEIDSLECQANTDDLTITFTPAVAPT